MERRSFLKLAGAASLCLLGGEPHIRPGRGTSLTGSEPAGRLLGAEHRAHRGAGAGREAAGGRRGGVDPLGGRVELSAEDTLILRWENRSSGQSNLSNPSDVE